MPRFDIGKLDDVIHGRVRLGIMAYLADAEAADFTELKTLLDVTQGNLSVHLRSWKRPATSRSTRASSTESR